MAKNVREVDLNLRSEEVQEILTNPPVWIVRWGITLVFILTSLVILVSFLIKYPDYLTAKVIVTTKEPTEKLIARNSGQIDKILINNKDTVHEGQRLAVIKNTANFYDVYYLKSIIDTSHFELKDFSFPIDSTSHLILGDIENAYLNFEKNYIEYSLLEELQPYSSELIGNEKSMVEIKERLQNQMAQKEILAQEIELKGNEYSRYKELFSKGIISDQEFESKKLEYLQMQKNSNSMAISISQLREAIISGNQAITNTIINRQEDHTRYFNNLAQSFFALKKAIRDWEYNYVLSSSTDGIVSFHDFWGINQYVGAGEVVFSILPVNKSELMGKLSIPSKNAGKAVIGQKVFVKLDNFPYQQFGMLIGNVKNISISPDDEGNYFVYINLPNGAKTSYNKQLQLNQELLGTAEIITEDLSVAERFFYKLRDVFKYN